MLFVRFIVITSGHMNIINDLIWSLSCVQLVYLNTLLTYTEVTETLLYHDLSLNLLNIRQSFFFFCLWGFSRLIFMIISIQ